MNARCQGNPRAIGMRLRLAQQQKMVARLGQRHVQCPVDERAKVWIIKAAAHAHKDQVPAHQQVTQGALCSLVPKDFFVGVRA